MKKKSKWIIVFICLILLTGCSKKTESGTEISSKTDTSNSRGSLFCTRSATAKNNAQVNLSYEVDYNKGYITKLHSTEQLITNDSATLDEYEQAYKKVFSVYKDLKYYNNKITRKTNEVIADTIIQYDKIDIDKLKELENTDDSVIKDGKVALSDWLKFAEKFGTKCTEK